MKSERSSISVRKMAVPLMAAVWTWAWVVQAGQGRAWLEFMPGPGAGDGRRVVLISGDEEYRSEEAMPMLGQLLALRHGFRCTVLFALDPESGVIDRNRRDHIPGLERLAEADLMIVFTRFRELPDEQMRYIHEYLESGRPVIGIRPSVVAFRNPPGSRYFRYSSLNRTGPWAGGFGQRVLGSTWISHHGRHGHQSTRGVPVESQRAHPILRGVGVMWGPTDVYTVHEPIPDDGRVLVRGYVLAGMQPEDAVTAKPSMPLAWTKVYPAPGGRARVFMTTMGASQDFLDESFRRLVVNACYWAVGLEDRIPARNDVRFVTPYYPSPFGFDRFVRGLRPSDLAVRMGGAILDGKPAR